MRPCLVGGEVFEVRENGEGAAGGLVRDAARLLAQRQGLTLVESSAQRKRFLWNRGCVWGLFKGC